MHAHIKTNNSAQVCAKLVPEAHVCISIDRKLPTQSRLAVGSPMTSPTNGRSKNASDGMTHRYLRRKRGCRHLYRMSFQLPAAPYSGLVTSGHVNCLAYTSNRVLSLESKQRLPNRCIDECVCFWSIGDGYHGQHGVGGEFATILEIDAIDAFWPNCVGHLSIRTQLIRSGWCAMLQHTFPTLSCFKHWMTSISEFSNLNINGSERDQTKWNSKWIFHYS